VRARLAAAVDELRRAAAAHGVGWVRPENLHLTLKFLGPVDEPRLVDVRAALAGAAALAAPFELAVAGLGAFPTPARPRVVWAGVDRGGAALAALAGAVEDALAPLGVPREARAFSAHVTLGRVRQPRGDPALAAALAAAAGRGFGVLRVARLSLMRSDLSPNGARYTEIDGWALGARAA